MLKSLEKNVVIIYNDSMKSIDKVIAKFRASQFGHTFEECKKVLEFLGFKETGSKGSHHKFTKDGLNRPFILAKHRPIDPAAINDILKLINKETEL